ncbi:hypothetical protein [Helicobacter pylori]|nr:hypothetical protein [Helicobacter pylori]
MKRSTFSLSSVSISANRENRGFVRGFDGMTYPNNPSKKEGSKEGKK